MRRGVVALVVAASGVATALAFAHAPRDPTAARRLLAEVRLPPGAVAVSTDPSGGQLAKPGISPGISNLVDLHRFWRVVGSPAEVASWIQAHPPAGSDGASFSGESGDSAGITVRWIGFSIRGGSNTLVFGVSAARSGATALRVDAQVATVTRRSASERVPRGVHAVEISDKRLGGPSRGPWTVTSPQRVRRIVSLINALPLGPAGALSCPADTGPYVKIRFLSAATGGQTIAKAVADGSGCGFVGLSIGDRREPFLAGGAGLVRQLSSLLGTSL